MSKQTQDERIAASPNGFASDPELMGDFLLESREHLGSIELQLLTLEHDPANAEAIHAIFRGFHTIKGLAGFLEFVAIQEVAHEVETVLDRARNGVLAITPQVVDGILEGKDYLASCIEELGASMSSGNTPDLPCNEALLLAIRSLIQEDDAQCEHDFATPPEPSIPDATALATPCLAALSENVQSSSAGAPKRSEQKPVESKLVKVETAKLDFLVEMVGEMMIAQSMLDHDPDLSRETRPRLARNLSHLAHITEEIQKTAMSMRMVPVGQLFQKMGRLVRDLSKKSGKQVELELVGEDTELDRHIVEEVADPLMHMVRNAVDHGIETPQERTRAGKNATARLILKAAHQAGHISIQVSDDGRGLNRDKILEKARKQGLVDASAEPPDQEVFHLIFQPGFSTAEKVTGVSGRGVGMDVVRRQIQKLRGRVDIASEFGRGATFFLKVPLTLAIIDGLVVGVGSERYIVPIYAVREMLRPSAEMVSTVQDRSEVVLVRGALIPVIRVNQRFGVLPRSTNPCDGILIVAESEQKKFALLVDHVVGKQEVVIKSLGPTLQGIPGVSGGAILGDGHVALILDLDGLHGARRAE